MTILAFVETPKKITVEEFVEHLERETIKATEYGTEVGLSLMAFIALASLVGIFISKL